MNKVVFWRPGIDEIYEGSKNVTGISLQLSIWAREFQSRDWTVFGLTNKGQPFSSKGVTFFPLKYPRIVCKLHISLLWDCLTVIRFILKEKPSLFVERGPSRTTLFNVVICNLLRVKFVFFSASDVNFVPGKDTIGAEQDTNMYRQSLKFIRYFVVQNQYQSETLLKNYQKKSLILPNIWIRDDNIVLPKKYDVIWISNLRPLKRAEWIINAAKQLSQFSFAIIGGANKLDYYNEIRNKAAEIDNLSFMGPKSIPEVNMLLAQSRVLSCTSEYEGFPNTFLQAWANNIPVISTVNPNDLITNYDLGVLVNTEEDFESSIVNLLSDDARMKQIQQSINNYFTKNYDSSSAYNQLMSYLYSL